MSNLTNLKILKLKLKNNLINNMEFVNNLDKLINLIDLEIDIKNSSLENERGIMMNLTKL